ncbi:alanine/ornithine racemase family PLP-dependent enzyme [Acidaminobacter sp. JC074]|uniref:alanine/ornithine racemase family PLP-dependent enzyme n=1 Tax=Acidaminobacter sp. JC074 TaxID=2530199 RepID=UPI001F111A66|nr:alanine/ornithine racemase family PLP-dependent enzyme [Acidaminobacter sp. JC074]MCH4889108.1 alanine/ornithine racemase family PLP-dependent enzyme [Acidaminobacter sp. JC074]
MVGGKRTGLGDFILLIIVYNKVKMEVSMYPRLEIDKNKIKNNLNVLTTFLNKEGIKMTSVIKGCASMNQVAELYVACGSDSLGSSRMSHLKRIKSFLDIETMLLRIPMLSEIEDVVKYADISLNSEFQTIQALNQACKEQKTSHDIILMMDLGDLREGYFDVDEMIEVAKEVERMNHINLKGIGANLSCYGSIRPTCDNMTQLVEVAEMIESELNRKLDIISGGATSTIPLIFEGCLPSRINHLRIGESVLLGRELGEFYECDLPLETDSFVIKAELVELKEKPSYPIGEMLYDAFGNKPEYIDYGIQKRGILAIGKQDIGSHEKLIPKDDRILVVGSSSDHLIVALDDTDYILGDVIEFELYYQPMLFAVLSSDVYKVFKG